MNWFASCNKVIGSQSILPSAGSVKRPFVWLVMALFCLTGSAEAGVFSSDFNSGTTPGAEIRGTAKMESTGGVLNTGVLKLTGSRPGESGSVIINDLDSGENIAAFDMRFQVDIGNGDGPAAGERFTVAFTDNAEWQTAAEELQTNGLIITFTTYLSVKGMTIPSASIRYNGVTLASSYFSLRSESAFADVHIELNRRAEITVSYNGATAFDHCKLPFKASAGRFCISAQTGTAADSHLLDNLWIKTEAEKNRPANQSAALPKPREALAKPQLLSDYSVRAWHIEDGLPQNMVQALAQTRDGYIWAGTRKGLARFDGVQFTLFNSNNTPELVSNLINAICGGKDGSLWVGTEAGLIRVQNGKFTRYTDGLPSEKVKVVREISDGSLIVGTAKGAVRLTNGKFGPILPNVPSKTETVRAITEDRNGDIWIGIANDIHWFQVKQNEAKVYAASNSISINIVRTICQDHKGTLWFGSTLGLSALTNDRWTRYSQKNGLSHSVVSAVYEDSGGNLWVGNYGGLNRMVNGKLMTEFNGAGEPFDVVNAICEDTEGNIWVGAKDGLYQLRRRRIDVYSRQHGLSYHNVTSVLEDRSGTIWMATWGGGLNRLKDGRFTSYNTRNSMASDLLLSLCEDHNGNLWVGTDYGGGAYQRTNGAFKYFGAEKGIVTSAIRVVYEDRQTNLWLGTGSCLQLVNFTNTLAFNQTNGLVGNNIRVILQDGHDNLWIGTTDGLSCMKDGNITNFTTAQGLSDNSVLALYEDSDGSLWIGTESGSLNHYRNGKFISFQRKDGLLNEEVFEILDDGLGSLWIASINGIAQVSKKSLDDFERGIAGSVSCMLLGKDDGMFSIQCNGVSKPAAWKSKDGRLWFATTKGVAVVDPKLSLKKNEIIPPVIVEKVSCDKKMLNITDGTAIVPPCRGDLEFHYTALSLEVPERNRFKYKLEGYDSDWVDAGTRRVAYYNNIDPGHYCFRVIACNNDGIWNERGASFPFHLEPHFYETGWFYAWCILSAGTCITGIVMWNVRRLKSRQKVLQALVEQRTKHLKEEIAERLKAQTQLLEVSRQAGMAEVASGVLHNVGNVLNSVNVSATLAMDRLKGSKQANLEKAFAMIREHSSDLAAFFSVDPKGKQLPEYLLKLSSHLSEEHCVTVRELTALCKNIDHIKDIISMQQKYAKISGITESVKLSELVQDALQMNAAASARHRINIRSDFTDDILISVDKHKVLQILVNLIQNARDACEAGGKSERNLIIQTKRHGNTVQIIVSDNGIGIPPENLTKIFSHGFTTRPNGHGFGLHNSALAAKELGGSLVAKSDGQNCGATFILEIPTQSPLENSPHTTKQDN